VFLFGTAIFKNHAECRLWTLPRLELHVFRSDVIHRKATRLVTEYSVVYRFNRIRRYCWNPFLVLVISVYLSFIYFAHCIFFHCYFYLRDTVLVGFSLGWWNLPPEQFVVSVTLVSGIFNHRMFATFSVIGFSSDRLKLNG